MQFRLEGPGGSRIRPIEDVGVFTLEQRVSEAAASVSAQLAELTENIVELLTREIPALRGDERVGRLLDASVAENVATMLHAFEHGIDPASIEAPTAAIAYSRRLAQRGVPIAALVRAYRIGQARFLHWCFEELLRQAAGDPIAGEATRRMVELSFIYIDRVSEQIINTYEEERDRWARNRSTVRMTRLRSLLGAEDVDLDAVELALGYRMHRHHLAIVAWFREPSPGGDELLLLERMVEGLSQHAGSEGVPLFVPVDDSSAWAWIPVGGDPSVADTVVTDAVGNRQLAICVCIGELGHDVEGFRRSHRQALQAQTIALAAGPSAPRVTSFADIRPIALMASDLNAARSWVQEILGNLAIDDEPQARLRETLHVFLSTGASYTSAAARLTLHKNSVHYRVQKAEEIRGRPIRVQERLEVELALLACHWLGPAVLSVPSRPATT